jgi:hypothetical protein
MKVLQEIRRLLPSYDRLSYNKTQIKKIDLTLEKKRYSDSKKYRMASEELASSIDDCRSLRLELPNVVDINQVELLPNVVVDLFS